MRKENYSCGETTEVCPNTTLGYLDPVYSVASKQRLNYRNLGEKKKREKKKRKKETYKNGAKALEKAFVTCLFSSLRALKFALPLHPYDETSHSYIFPLFSGELNQKASVHPTTMNS